MILYDIFIQPIEYLIEVVFITMYGFLGNAGLAVIAVSILVSTLVLPLYNKAELVQEKERCRQKEMASWIQHIKKAFSGDERMLILSAYYNEMGYSQLSSIKGMAPLLLQIPFFLAAYHFLSGINLGQISAFGPIPDLMHEDGLLQIGSFSINVLPILMTLINMVSSAIYTKGLSAREKIQPYVMALVFLVLLYKSPALLVLYWTMNNVYSLCKNIAEKYMKHPGYAITALYGFLAAAFLVYTVASGKLKDALIGRDDEIILYFAGFIILCSVAFYGTGLIGRFVRIKANDIDRRTEITILLLAELILTLVISCIPQLLLIEASPLEFYVADKGLTPLHYVFSAACVAAGACFVWGNIVYYFSSPNGKRIFEAVLCAFITVFIVDLFFFRAQTGTITTDLVCTLIPYFERSYQLINLLLVCIFPIPAFVIVIKKPRVARLMLTVIAFSLSVGFAFYAIRIQNAVNKSSVEFSRADQSQGGSAELPFSKNGRNVVVIMLDRAVGAYVPFLMDEKPELLEKFDGFTYYPNTVSPGFHTNFGAPPLYGGYEYTPDSMNERNDVLLADKNDEALKVMPVIFDSAGYEVNVADLPYIHYDEDGAPLFEDYPDIVYHEYAGNLPSGFDEASFRKTRERNFFFYGLMKLTPATFQDEIYDRGKYLSGNRVMECGGVAFYNAYSVLENLEALCYPVNAGDCFFLLCNNTPHEPALLSLPDYDIVPADPEMLKEAVLTERTIDGRTLRFDPDNIESNLGSYHSTMAAFLKLGDWFDQLREWGVYDNTRIILVSDHGGEMHHFDDFVMDNGIDAEGINALLMVKDFGDSGFTTDTSFMTNADTVALATAGIGDGVTVNPFTGNEITMDGKKDGILVVRSDYYNVAINNGYTFISNDNRWFRVRDDFSDEENWEELP